jgi:RHS repeat-associated protein
LSTVTTKVWNGSSYDSVDRWTLTHTFPDPGDGTRAGLWLSKLSHTGLAGGSESVPDVEFSGVQMNNRVDTIDFAAAMNWWRISQIRYESGGTVSVLYSDPECVAQTNVPTSPASNTKRCYPVRWTPEGYQDPVIDYFHKYVVTTVYEADNTGGVTPKGSPRVVYKYSYLGAPAWHYTDDDGLIEAKDKTWSVWRGYSRVGVTVGDAGEQSYTETKYFRGMHGDKAASGTRTVTVTGTGVPTVNDEDAYAGMARESTVYNGPDGAVVSRQVTEPWQSDATASRTINGDTVQARFTAAVASHDRTVLDGGRGERVHSVRNTFDAYGMTVAVDDAGDDAVTGDETCTMTTYEPRNTTAWVMTAAHRALTLAVPCASADDLTELTDDDVVSDTRTYFDGATIYGTAPTRGLVTRTEQAKAWNAGSPTYEQVSRAAYDSGGRITSAWDALNHQSTIAYTSAGGGLVTQTVLTNALGHTTTTTINPAWGVPTKVVDPNGKTTEVTYDGLGRLTAVWQPGRDKATQTASSTFSYLVSNTAPSAVGTNTLNAAGNYLTSYALYDGLLRPRQTQSPSPSGGRLLTDIFYDSAGRQVREHGSYYASGAASTTLSTATDRQDVPNQTSTVYDGAGRITASIFQPYTTERWRTTTAYGGDRVDVTPPSGGTASSTLTDALGRTTAVRQYHAATPTGAYDTTTYTFNRKSQLTRVTDAAGNHWDYTYDLRGRQLTAADPDKGTTTSTYDAAGRVTSTVDARGIKLQYGYDNLDRRTAVFQTGVGTRARWFYDNLAKGQLDKSIRYVGVTNYTRRIEAYDDAYRPIVEAYEIPSTETGLGGKYAVNVGYNVDGSLDFTTYPAAGDLPLESVSYHYDTTTGLPTNSTSGFGGRAISYAARTTYDALGRISELMLYPGLYDDLGKRVYQTFGYELETGRLTSTRTDRDSVAPYTVTNTSYSYDNAGNVTRSSDAATGDNQCFQYDYLRRLTQAWTPATSNCNTAPSTAGLGGPAPYWQSWAYDVTGNRRSQVDHATISGGLDTTTTYNYPATGSSRPHALSGTTVTTGSSSVTAGYTYDNTGNTLTRPTASGNGTLTWDPEGHLASSTDSSGTTSYIYDADGNRLVSRDSAGTTLFLPGQDIRYTAATGATTCTRYYTFGGSTIASRTAAGVTWLSSDHQGTATVAIDRDTQSSTIRRQTPFGTSRGTSAIAWPNSRGFVGGTLDNTGLTHLGAREYDAGIGRFISVDPVQDLADPQQWNGYAYAGNNPTTLSDPSGLRAQDPELDNQFGTPLEGTGKSVQPGERHGHGGSGSARKGNAKGDITVVETLGADKQKIAHVCVTDVLCLDQYQVTNIQAFINAYNAQIASLSQGNGGQTLADFQYLMAIVNACGDGVKLSENCSMPAYLMLSNGAAEAAVHAETEAHGTPAWKTGLAAIGMIGEAISGLPACQIRAFAAGGRKSFSADTQVLMADGTTKTFKDVKEGDEVQAADPETGQKGIRKVQTVWVHDDDLYTLTIDGKPLTTTEDHPFWDETDGHWERADDLEKGDVLLTPTGAPAHVDGFSVTTHRMAPAYNLTIDDLHTYYVLAGKTPVLVHNTGCGTGAKRGPKPAGTGPHNLKIEAVGRSVTDGEIIAGGGVLPERAIATPGGFKGSRRPDILVRRPDGSIYGINVGKQAASGAPIKREAQAISDLEGAGIEMHFVPYN